MKYNIGDKVRVKSLEWYNANKDEYGDVKCYGCQETDIKCQDSIYFIIQMSEYCGKIVTIDKIWEDYYYSIIEDEQRFDWTDDMFEDDDLEFQRAVAKAVDECLWGTDDEINVYKETDPTEKLVDDSVEFGKNVMRKKISEYLLKYLPMTPDDKEAFVEEMNKNIL
jgi:hypothetical protein